eukprot:CAMPEP_0119303618 /NCGR_PEP_ID=MMETSP1333-20130426/5029_1 /TAXON_ID=418940 /ORGANISM="Scyphosphaera apsteinii, Strain RCC1455" /LENGTH=219 /DNA_ID=CAMNT_0007306345 /DNA_START=234 /DNA_END=893 /DNA_ORIENTATION=+
MAAIICGKPIPFLCNEALVPVCLVTWLITYRMPVFALESVFDCTLGNALISVLYEIQRCHVLMNCAVLSAVTLPAALAQPSQDRAAVIGPLISGLLGGCGGGFMPLNKGLDPLAAGSNWRIGSSAVASIWLFLTAHYPTTKAVIGLSTRTARVVAVIFFVAMPLIEQATGLNIFGKNPLVRCTFKTVKMEPTNDHDKLIVKGTPVTAEAIMEDEEKKRN